LEGCSVMNRPKGSIVAILCGSLFVASCTSQSSTDGSGIPSHTESAASHLLLREAPADCGGQTPRRVEGFSGAIGTSPVLAVGFEGTAATLRVGDNTSRREWGWPQKVLFLVNAGTEATVAVAGHDSDGRPLTLSTSTSAGRTHELLLRKAIPGRSRHRWREYPSYVYVPQADCFVLTADWGDGSWSRIFAGGR